MLTTDKQIEEVIRLRDDENKTFLEIAEKLELSDRTVRRRYQAGVLNRAAGMLINEATSKFPDIPSPIIVKVSDLLPEKQEEIERFKPMILKGDAILTCDLHIPLYDASLVNVMIKVAKKYNIKKIIIAGDYFNMEDVSSYPPYQPEASMTIEKEQGTLVMKTLLKWFDGVHMFWGNHEHRLSRSTGFKYSFTECMKWMLESLTKEEISKIHFSDLDYMYYYPGRDRKVRVCHPSSYSDIPLTIGRKLAVKYGCSVYTAHCHHLAIGFAPNGFDFIIEGGGFFDKNRTEYIQRTNPNHEWMPGFFYFKDGIPNMISPTLGTDLEYRKEVK